jgi:hypothetical protein
MHLWQWVVLGLLVFGIIVMCFVWVLCAAAADTDDLMGTR